MGVHPQLAAVERVAAGSRGDMQSVGNHVLGLKPGTPSPPCLDVHFNTDPLFVRAGIDGMAVPRGLSGVESDTSVPVLKFKSDDAYATAAELSRRASAAKEMRAALAAQISAKRMVTSKAFDADDHYEAHLEASRTLDVQDAVYSSPRPPSGSLQPSRSDTRLPSFRGSPPLTACSLTAREPREPYPSPSPRGAASESFNSRGAAIPARRAAAAREIQGALDAQMRAAALLQARMNPTATTSSDETSASSLAIDREPAPLAAWEQTASGLSAATDTATSSMSSISSVGGGWHAHSSRPRISMHETVGNSAVMCSVSLADGVASGGGSGEARGGGGGEGRGGEGRDEPPQVPPLPTSHSTTESHISFGEARSMHSGRSTGHADDLKLSPGGRFGRPGGNPMSRAAVPILRFRSDDAYATEAELSARANASARLRADLDRQVAEKQQRREQERGEGGDAGAIHGRFRSPLSHRSSGGSGRITPRSRFDAADLPPRGGASASPRSARLGISSGIGRSPSDGIGRSPSDGPRSSGLSHVIDGFGREGSARENDVPGMENHAAEALLKGLEGLKGSQTPRPPLQPSGNLTSPRPLVSARYTSMPTPLFDSADTTPLPTARDSVDGGRAEPQSARGIPRSARGEPQSARGPGPVRTLSSEISPRIPLPSPRQLSQYNRGRVHEAASGGLAAVGAGSQRVVHEDPVERSWRLAKEEAERARKRRVRAHAAAASPELLADLEASAETGASSDAVEQPPTHDSAAVTMLPRVDDTDETSLGTTCSSSSSCGGPGVPCGDHPAKSSMSCGPSYNRRRPWSWFTCCLCGKV